MGAVRVCCTHLDHISENERAIQAGGLVRQLHDLRGDSKAMLVVGDLNALNDEAKWDRLDAIHEENGWAPPEDSTVPGGASSISRAEPGKARVWKSVRMP